MSSQILCIIVCRTSQSDARHKQVPPDEQRSLFRGNASSGGFDTELTGLQCTLDHCASGSRIGAQCRYFRSGRYMLHSETTSLATSTLWYSDSLTDDHYNIYTTQLRGTMYGSASMDCNTATDPYNSALPKAGIAKGLLTGSEMV